jgi:hypothetical protein
MHSYICIILTVKGTEFNFVGLQIVLFEKLLYIMTTTTVDFTDA